MQTWPYPTNPTPESRVLVIGHDPRLRKSETLAQHAFFADLFFTRIPATKSDLAKYELAKAVFAYIGELTSYRYNASQLVLTNLCNVHLPHAPKGKVVLIPRPYAESGLHIISALVQKANIELIFAMSEQVNYWLQELDFCQPQSDFLERAAPKPRGVASRPPFYEPHQQRAFQGIAFRRHTTRLGIPLYPIVHVRSWPFRGPFEAAYGRLYSACISELKAAA